MTRVTRSSLSWSYVERENGPSSEPCELEQERGRSNDVEAFQQLTHLLVFKNGVLRFADDECAT